MDIIISDPLDITCSLVIWFNEIFKMKNRWRFCFSLQFLLLLIYAQDVSRTSTLCPISGFSFWCYDNLYLYTPDPVSLGSYGKCYFKEPGLSLAELGVLLQMIQIYSQPWAQIKHLFSGWCTMFAQGLLQFISCAVIFVGVTIVPIL